MQIFLYLYDDKVQILKCCFPVFEQHNTYQNLTQSAKKKKGDGSLCS